MRAISARSVSGGWELIGRVHKSQPRYHALSRNPISPPRPYPESKGPRGLRSKVAEGFASLTRQRRSLMEVTGFRKKRSVWVLTLLGLAVTAVLTPASALASDHREA